uniref:LysM domain-containing protein n=1 Tax=Pyramimonas obovata TaxID=1411642 RepID=A0A7S0REQ4_9CHLO|mmetsp:Transcript_31922/g.69715  ORF Transcript_31922/g.69715 Transcript_31922/m.69715 type:complete len:261 (+) Transcript_31922:117-899(+)|eukprot:CAMPEP_0118933878 /NCGR_PEP_ID=MMETSP1169-20130426/12820_1 /TAXON_ID=36882 /ORGANISM="Pyramimonas obovata, Strain CCMP722" /LENGTH=260 /DNA_ID=CAMNT_0006876701 /DNA_START=66 /DNA_END=848 /DNA_ORIENTATION=+
MPSTPVSWSTPPRKGEAITPSQEAGSDRVPEGDDDEGMGGFLEFFKFVGSIAATVLVTGWIVEKSKTAFKPRGKYITVTLEDGDTLGGLVTKYVGDYTDENIMKIQKINKKQIKDMDLLQPGMVLRIPDNRRTELATAEKDWWKRRANTGSAPEMPTVDSWVDETALNKEFENLEKAKAPEKKGFFRQKKKESTPKATPPTEAQTHAQAQTKDAEKGEKGPEKRRSVFPWGKKKEQEVITELPIPEIGKRADVQLLQDKW